MRSSLQWAEIEEPSLVRIWVSPRSPGQFFEAKYRTPPGPLPPSDCGPEIPGIVSLVSLESALTRSGASPGPCTAGFPQRCQASPRLPNTPAVCVRLAPNRPTLAARAVLLRACAPA